MVTFFGKGEILKGSDAELTIELVPCNVHADINQLENYTCYIYTTPGGFAIARNLDYFEIVGNVGTTHLQRVHLDKLKDGVIRYTIEFDFDGDHYITEKNTGYYLKTPIDYTPVDFVDRQEMEDYVDEAVSEAISGSSPTVFLRVDANGSWIQQEEDGSDLKAFIEMAKVDPTKCCTVYISTNGNQFNGTVEYSQSVQISDVSGITHNGARIVILQPVAQSQTIRYTAMAYADENGIYWSGGRNVGNTWEYVSSPGQGQQGLYVHVDITDPDNPVVDGFGLSLKPVVDGYVEIDDSTPSIVSGIKTFISGVTGMLELREYCNIWCYSGGSLWNTVYVTEPILSTEGSGFVYMEAAFFPAHWERRYLLKMYIDGGRYFTNHSGPIKIYLECIKEEDAAGDYVTSAETQQMIDDAIAAIPAYSGASEEYVQSAITEATSGLVSEDTMRAYVDAMVPSLEGYATEVYVGDAISDYNTIVEAYVQESISGFTTSAETQALISAATADFITSADTAGFLTSADTQAFITSADTQDFITSADTSNFVVALTATNKIWGGSAQAYSALTSYDPNTFYFVDPEE